MKAFSDLVPAVIVFISSQGVEEGEHHQHPPPRSAPSEGVYIYNDLLSLCFIVSPISSYCFTHPFSD